MYVLAAKSIVVVKRPTVWVFVRKVLVVVPPELGVTASVKLVARPFTLRADMLQQARGGGGKCRGMGLGVRPTGIPSRHPLDVRCKQQHQSPSSGLTHSNATVSLPSPPVATKLVGASGVPAQPTAVQRARVSSSAGLGWRQHRQLHQRTDNDDVCQRGNCQVATRHDAVYATSHARHRLQAREHIAARVAGEGAPQSGGSRNAHAGWTQPGEAAVDGPAPEALTLLTCPCRRR